MFNGIIFNKGIVSRIKKSTKGVNIFVKSNLKVKKKDLCVSICCDGVCLTMVSIKGNIMEFYLPLMCSQHDPGINDLKFSDHILKVIQDLYYHLLIYS